jgi:RNA polymerase sigma factor (sigma-70 family)
VDQTLTVTAPTESGSSFETFFEAQNGRLLRALYLVCGSRDEAEDLSQEALVRVWERWDRVQRMDDPVGYLYRTAMNLLRSRARRLATAARRVVRLSGDPDVIAATEDRDVVRRALAHLTLRQRTAIVLTEYLGYSNEEAAGLMSVRPVTVRVLTSQGRASLRERLGGTDDE